MLRAMERMARRVASLLRGRCANDAHPPEASDPYVARAIAAMKADPSRRWTVAALARVACLSRAPFARRFRRVAGVPPMRWLTEHRLRTARARLIDTDLTLAGIAAEVGYDSEFAFAKAFKRLFGIAPGRFRRLGPGSGRASTFRAAA